MECVCLPENLYFCHDLICILRYICKLKVRCNGSVFLTFDFITKSLYIYAHTQLPKILTYDAGIDRHDMN